MTRGKVLFRAVQLLALVGAAWFMWRVAHESWPAIQRMRLTVLWVPLVVGSAVVMLKDLGLVWLWVYSLRWWGAKLPYAAALRIWVLTNLARFVPGAVWQFAGLAVMSVTHGVSAVATMGAVLLQQGIILATGGALAIAIVPQALGSGVPPAGTPLSHLASPLERWAATVSPLESVAVGAALLAAVVVVLPRLIPLLGTLATKVVRRPVSWPAPATGSFAAYALGLVAHWLSFAAAFWLFGLALLGRDAPGPVVAMAAFIASYVAGIAVVVAPGGLGVREVALVALLEPAIGPERALVLAVTSRLWLFAVELLTALGVMTFARPRPPAASHS